MSLRLAAALLVATSLLSAPALANEPADLRLQKFPTVTPSSLVMRVARAQPQQTDDEQPGDGKQPDSGESTEEALDPEVGEDVEILEIEARLRERIRASDALGQRRALDEKVVLQVSLGIGIDGGQPSEEGILASGAVLEETQNYARLRSYGFGDLVIGTNGLGSRSLRSYFASGYRFDTPTRRDSAPIPSVYDGAFNDFVVRSAWIDIEDVFERPLLKPLYLRVGRQYKYGAAIAQFSGLTVGYKTRSVGASVWSGTRAEPYSEVAGQEPISGADISVDLYELKRVPLVLTASVLRFDNINHLDAAAALRFGRNSLLRGKVRTVAGDLAQESVRLRTRLTEVTTVSAELDNRHANDWAYDLLLVALRPGDAAQTDAKTYLNLGPPRPRVRTALRAGTVLLRNIDLLASVAAAVEYARNAEFAPTSTRSSYLEAGSAVEIRVRRGFRLGVSGMARAYARPEDELPAQTDGIADALPETNAGTGETTFVEGGASLRYSLGARVFSASAEFYGRRFRFQSPYSMDERPTPDFRSGGRFSIDGWATKQIRLRLDYDLSLSSIRYAPELAGVKTLRATIEGTF